MNLNDRNKPFSQLVRKGNTGKLFAFSKCDTKNKNGRYENKYSRFTKTELAKIMDGALYKTKYTPAYFEDLMGNFGYIPINDDLNGKHEWINPIIEIVPVDEDKQ